MSINYKQQRLAKLREQVKILKHTAESMEAWGFKEEAKTYRLQAARYCDEAIRISRMSGWQIYREDRETAYQFQKMYAGAVELFV